jgi:hypothetical protein
VVCVEVVVHFLDVLAFVHVSEVFHVRHHRLLEVARGIFEFDIVASGLSLTDLASFFRINLVEGL